MLPEVKNWAFCNLGEFLVYKDLSCLKLWEIQCLKSRHFCSYLVNGNMVELLPLLEYPSISVPNAKQH